ncbi:MAG: hypothetical protein ACFCUJ_14860 [Thiotrichales bacterium]
MLLDTYEQRGLFYNTNFKEATTAGHYSAYRGDLVLVEGAIADAMGRRKPPTVTLKAAVVLADAGTLRLVSGSLDELADIEPFLDLYGTDLAPDVRAVFYVVNLSEPLIVLADGKTFVLIPMADGLVWNELTDELKLEKSDFKGQSAADKVLTVLDAFSDYAPKYRNASFEDAMSRTIAVKRESRGPV